MHVKLFIAPIAASILTLVAACGEEATDTAGVSETASAAAETLANGLTAKATIEARQAGFKKLGKAIKTIFDNGKASPPDMAVIKEAALSIPVITEGIETWFPAGSGPDSGIKTAALAAIWEKPEDFAGKVASFQTASAALAAAAQTDELGAIMAAAGKTGGTCKACHDSYKKD